jgi:hypothetical protein
MACCLRAAAGKFSAFKGNRIAAIVATGPDGTLTVREPNSGTKNAGLGHLTGAIRVTSVVRVRNKRRGTDVDDLPGDAEDPV